MAIQETFFNNPSMNDIKTWVDNNCSQFFEDSGAANGIVTIRFTSSSNSNFIGLETEDWISGFKFNNPLDGFLKPSLLNVLYLLKSVIE